MAIALSNSLKPLSIGVFWLSLKHPKIYPKDWVSLKYFVTRVISAFGLGHLKNIAKITLWATNLL
jgi:hypothetical protein